MAIDEAPDHGRKTCAVLGGRNFVGRPLVSKLLHSGDWIVRIADSASSLVLDSSEENSVLSDAVVTGRASYFQVDLRKKDQICQAIRGSSVVFYIDASDPQSRDFYSSYTWIVQGAKNVIYSCKECGVEKLIYNSSADVVFDGVQSVENADESLPCPARFADVGSELRAQAESLVLFSNGSQGLLTCALRPSCPFGPGDQQFISWLLEAAKSGHTKFIIGNGGNLWDFTYVENIAHAHILAEQALHPGNDYVAGKAFFITNLEPVKLWEFISLILEGLGYERPNIRVPAKLVNSVAVLHSWIEEKWRLQKNAYLSSVHQFSCTRTFDCLNAQKHLGYSPIVTFEEGVTVTIQAFSHLSRESPFLRSRDFSQPSKADRLLGNGKVAEILLWRDEKKTFTCAVTLHWVFYWFFLSGRTFITSMSTLLLLLLIVNFSQSILSSSRFGSTAVPLFKPEVSESDLKDVIVSLVSAWNTWVVQTLRVLAKGEDFYLFVKVLCLLYILKLLLPFSSAEFIGVGLVCLFTTFFVYEQHEDQVDKVKKVIVTGATRTTEFLVRNLPVSFRLFLQQNNILSLKND